MINKNLRIRPALLIPVIILMTMVLSVSVWAERTQTMGRLEAENLQGSEWMSGISDDTLISDLTIPGTKASAMQNVSDLYAEDGTAAEGAVSYQGPSESVKDQLDQGVRILQIGLSSEGDAVWDPDGTLYGGKAIYISDSTGSGLVYAVSGEETETALTFENFVNDTVKAFLEENTDETVILLLKPAGTAEEETVSRLNAYLSELAEKLNPAADKSLLYTENGAKQYTKFPTLSDCRGRIVILSEFVDKDGKNLLTYGMAVDSEKDALFVREDSGWMLREPAAGDDADGQPSEKDLWLSNFPEYFEVTCVTGIGTQVLRAQVKAGTSVTKPEDPTRDHYSFDGWYTDETYETAWNFDNPITENLTLYAKWVKNFRVVFNLNYSFKQFETEVKPGTPVEEPETPQREGFTFEKWYADPSFVNEYHFDDPVTEDLALYAAWTCTLTFDSNGGTEIPAQEVRTGEAPDEPLETPKKDGLTFAGWYTNPSLTQPFNFGSGLQRATTVYARWTALVTFAANGGTGVMQAVAVNEGQMYSLPSCAFTPPRGYRFDTWDLGPAGTRIQVNGPVSLQAVWKENSSSSGSYTGNYNVTFYTNGGSDIPSQSVSYGSAVQKPADPVRQGFQFENWYTDGRFTQVYDFQQPVTTSLTLYAKWISSEQFTISFDANGGSGEMASVYVERGANYILPGCSFTAPEGKSFLRWNYGETGTEMTVNSDMIMSAQWGEIERETQRVIYRYTLHFDTRGGSEIEDQVVETGNLPVRPENPTRRSYIFDGWYRDEALQIPYDFQEEVESDMTIYAGWVSGVLTGEISYSITRGENQEYEKGSGRDITIVAERSWDDEACYSHFTNVMLDDRILAKGTDYQSRSGSTIITFSGEFLDSLENGEHWVKILFNDGSAETPLKVSGTAPETSAPDESTPNESASDEESAEVPVTDDPSQGSLSMWICLLVLSACMSVCLWIVLFLTNDKNRMRFRK